MKRVTYTIATLLGRQREVSGYEIVPGIATHKTESWQIVHFLSGLSLQNSRQSFPTRQAAITYVRKLVRAFLLVDWTASSGAVDKGVRKAAKVYYKGYVMPALWLAVVEMAEGKKPKHKILKRKRKARLRSGSHS